MLIFQETLEAKKQERDFGFILGAKLTVWVRKIFNIPRKQRVDHEREPLLAQRKPSSDEEAPLVGDASDTATGDKPRIRDLLSYQTTLILVVYTFLAMYSLAYDQVSVM